MLANPKSEVELNIYRVEHIFGFMTNSMNDALHLGQIGQQRITATIGFVNLTYNLFKFEQLIRLKIV
jgi:transposase, IS5 family